jgi:hypothetical protein
MRKEIVFFVFVGLVLCGCAQTTYIPYEQPIIQEIPQVKESLHVKTSGIIKGDIKSLYFDASQNLWFYEVVSVDTANGKLPYLKFSASKMIAKKGDKIYAVVKEEKLVEYFLIDAPNLLTTPAREYQNEKVEQNKTHKRTKARKTPWIEVPKSESIDLD